MWYGLGRWRGRQAIGVLSRLLRVPDRAVTRAQDLLAARPFGLILTARFLPELNPVAAGLAGTLRLRLPRYLPAAAGSALVWAGTWIGVGHLAGEALEGMAGVLDMSCVVGTATVLGAVAMTAAVLKRAYPRAAAAVMPRSPDTSPATTRTGHP